MTSTTSDPAAQEPRIAPPLRPRAERLIGARTVVALILREMTTTYGRTPGGYVWAILQPVAMIAMLTVAFSLFLRSPSLGTNFVLFYATGVLPLRTFQNVSAAVSGAMSFNRALLGYPRVTFMDSILARLILSVLTQIMIFAVVLSGVFLFFDVREIIAWGTVIEAFSLAVLIGMGAGVANCFLFHLVPAWAIVWSILTRPLIFVSGIFYIYEELPTQAQAVLWFNPMIHITGLMRRGFYATYDASFVSVLYVSIFAVLPLVLGLVLLRQFSRDVLHL